jgi:hypothetical protein
MKASVTALGLSFVVALGVGGLAPVALAAHHHSHHDGARGFGVPVAPRPFIHHHVFPRHFLPVSPFIVFVSPAVIYAAPPVVYQSTTVISDPAPVYPYTAVAPSAPPPPPPPPPLPSVIDYPTGRYELRGDGVYTPYTWVWIPKPPPPPPAPPPAAVDEVNADSSSRVAVEQPPAVKHRQTLFHWTDDNGVANWTDQLNKVPARYRTQAQRGHDL